MTDSQLLKLLKFNRKLLWDCNVHAYEHLLMLNRDYGNFGGEEVELNLELNNSIAEMQFNSQFDIAIKNSLKILRKYKNSVYKIPVVNHYILLGRCYTNTGKFEKAEQSLLYAAGLIAPEDPEYVFLKVDILHVLTMNEQIAERGSEKSIQYLTEAIQLLKDDTSAKKAGCFMALGNVYINADDIENALEKYRIAAITFEHNFDLANLGNVYCNIGTCYLKMDNFDTAENYFKKSLEFRMKVGSPEHLSISYYNMALVYKAKRELDTANDLLLKCKDILIQTNNNPFLNDIEIELAAVALLKAKQPATV